MAVSLMILLFAQAPAQVAETEKPAAADDKEIAISFNSGKALLDLDTGSTMGPIARGGPSLFPAFDLYAGFAGSEKTPVLHGQLRKFARIKDDTWNASHLELLKKIDRARNAKANDVQILAYGDLVRDIQWLVETKQGGILVIRIQFREKIKTQTSGEQPGFLVQYKRVPTDTAPDAESVPSSVSPEGVQYLARLRRGTPFGTDNFDMDSLRAGMGSRRPASVPNLKLAKTKAGEVPGEWVLAPGADPNVRLLYLHGGGFVSGSGGYYLPLAAHISSAAKCAVLLIDYRLAPEHRFPAGLDDCVQAHEWMTANGPDGRAPATATFVAGDSAGGNLTLATVLALRDRMLSLPTGAISISATTDLTLASESLRTAADPIISPKTMPIFRDHYLGDTDPKNPLASPVFGDYQGLPPLLLQVGEHEMLLDDSIRVARKARADGIQVRLEVWPGMFHVFQSHEPLLPEGKLAIQQMAKFIQTCRTK